MSDYVVAIPKWITLGDHENRSWDFLLLLTRPHELLIMFNYLNIILNITIFVSTIFKF